MKNLTLLLALIFVTQQMSAQLTTQQWRDDLQFLKQTVHSKYPNLFHKVTAEQFDAAVDALEKRLPNLKDYETVAEMSKIVAMFRIGHTQLSLTPRLRHVATLNQHRHHSVLCLFNFICFQMVYTSNQRIKNMQTLSGARS